MMEPIPILLYHGVGPTYPGLEQWILPEKTFARQMEEVVRRGHTALTVSELAALTAAGATLPERPVVISFDDGLASFADHAWPILQANGLPASMYVVTGYVGLRAGWLDRRGVPGPLMLSWLSIVDLETEGCEIGAHTETHPALDTLSVAGAREEIRRSGAVLSARLGHAIRPFAYPFGYHTATVREAVIDAGFENACAVMNRLSWSGDDRFALARVTITPAVDFETFGHILNGTGAKVADGRERLRTQSWRAWRKTRHGLSRAR